MGRIITLSVFAMIFHVCVGQISSECLTELPKCVENAVQGSVDFNGKTPDETIQIIMSRGFICKLANGIKDCLAPGKCDNDPTILILKKTLDTATSEIQCDCDTVDCQKPSGCIVTGFSKCAENVVNTARAFISSSIQSPVDIFDKIFNRQFICNLAKGFNGCLTSLTPSENCKHDPIISLLMGNMEKAISTMQCDCNTIDCQGQFECVFTDLPKCTLTALNGAGVDFTEISKPQDIMQKLNSKEFFCKFSKGFKECVDSLKPSGKCKKDTIISSVVLHLDNGEKAQKCGCGSIGASIALVIVSAWFLVWQRKA